MKKILLVGPYKNSDIRIGQYLSPPLGIYRIKSYIEKNTEVEVDVIDVDLKGEDYFINALKNNYGVIGFSLLQNTLKNDLFLIFKARELSPNSLLIAGGQGAVFNYNLLLKETPLDIVVKGFGEFTLLEILKNPNQLNNIRGLYLKDKDNTIIDTGKVKEYSCEQFKEISLYFDFEKVPYEEYWNFMEKIYTKKHLRIMKNEYLLHTIRMITSSHCPRKCIFCSSTNFLDNACKQQKRIALSAKDIYGMVKKAVGAHPKCRAIYFNDDDFLFDKERIMKLCLLLQNIKDVSYFCLSRIDNIEKELLCEMKRVGFKFIIYGVESFSNDLLMEMNKNILTENPKEFSKKIIKETLDADITPLMNIILFYPTTNLKDIMETIEDTLELVNYGARLTVYSYVEVYPGSKILEKNNLNFIYESFIANVKKFKLPMLILPHSKKIRDLAEKSIKLSKKLTEEILKKYNWRGVVPHPLNGLILFLAVYKTLEIETTKIENLINKIMVEESKNGVLKCYQKVSKQ